MSLKYEPALLPQDVDRAQEASKQAASEGPEIVPGKDAKGPAYSSEIRIFRAPSTALAADNHPASLGDFRCVRGQQALDLS